MFWLINITIKLNFFKGVLVFDNRKVNRVMLYIQITGIYTVHYRIENIFIDFIFILAENVEEIKKSNKISTTQGIVILKKPTTIFYIYID